MSPISSPPDDSQYLLQQFDDLAARVRALAETGFAFPDIVSQIADGRDRVASGRLPEAQALYTKASAGLDRAEASVRAEPLARRLLWVEVFYLLVILALGYITKRWPGYGLWAGLIGINAKAAWFGAVGGVTIGIYGVYSHIAAKDFDASFRLWYLCKPIVGAIFGWFVVLVYLVGVLTANADGKKLEPNNPDLAYLIAFLAGFSERFTIKTIDRFMTVLTSGDEKSKNKDKTKTADPSPNS